MPILNHNTVVSGYGSLKAIPISGTVQVRVTNSAGEIVGQTQCNPRGEWLQSFTLDDGTYTVRFSGNFRPIGKDKNSRYAARVRTQNITVTLTTPEVPTQITDILEIVSGEPKYDNILASKGSNWTPVHVSKLAVDLKNEQQIDGGKSFIQSPFFQKGITLALGQSISIGPETGNETANITFTFEEGFKFTTPTNVWLLSNFATRLNELSDVVDTTLTVGNVLGTDGNIWYSASPAQLGIADLSSEQIISGRKTFQQPVSFPLGSYITEIESILTLSDSTGTYSLSQLAVSSLSDLSDVSDASGTGGELLVYLDGSWSSSLPENANIVTINSSQTVSGQKTFNAGIVINSSVSGNAIDTSLVAYTADHLATSGAIVNYLENNFLRLDASNDPITDDLVIEGNLLVDGDLDVTGSMELGTVIVTQILGQEDSGGTCDIYMPCTLHVDEVRIGVVDGSTELQLGGTNGNYVSNGLIVDGEITITENNRLQFTDSNTEIWEDGSGNLSFKDANAGTLTLSDLTKPNIVWIDDYTCNDGVITTCTDGTNWNVDKAIIKTIKVTTTSTDWNLYIFTDSTAVGGLYGSSITLVQNASGNLTIHLDIPYEDNDTNQAVYFTFVDDAGSTTADITVLGVEAR